MFKPKGRSSGGLPRRSRRQVLLCVLVVTFAVAFAVAIVKIREVRGASDHVDVPSQRSTTEPRPISESYSLPLRNDLFSVVMLSYKSPLSLANTIESLALGGVFQNPNFRELLVYFQVFSEDHDTRVVREAILRANRAVGNENASIPYRILGSRENLPVATATFTAIRSVTTALVLYLECDRPIFAFPSLTREQRVKRVRREIDSAVHYTATGKSDVYRLQLYSSPLISDEPQKAGLPLSTYGDRPHYHCQRASLYANSSSPSPDPDRGICLRPSVAKRKYGPVFNTAYCKHWKKLNSAKDSPQQDLCDSFCFVEWATMWHRLSSASPLRAEGQLKLSRHVEFTKNQEGELVLCLTSEACNWTNQPTMYRASWYLQHIAAPCESSPAFCIGKPGRQSAVRQELYFVKQRKHWADTRHKICLGSGLFVHHEIDNRE